MEYVVSPLESEFGEDQLEYLEMVVLLVSHDIDVRIEGILAESLLGSTEVLGDVNGSTVRALDNLPVQTVGSEVAPDRAIRIGDENSFLESFTDKFLAQKVGIMLVIYLVECDSESTVSLVEAFEHPAVHHGPEVTDFLVASFPLLKHHVSFLEARSLLLGLFLTHPACHQLLDFLLVDVVEGHIHVTDQMVALDAAGLRRCACSDFLPGKHRLADVDTPVVDKSRPDHIVSRSLEQPGDRISEKVVPDVSQVERLVRVR